MGTRMFGQLNDKVNKQVIDKTVNLDFSSGNQVIQENGKLFNKVTVNKSTDFTAENIRSGKTLGNIQGTASAYENGATANDIKVGKKALVNGVDVDGAVEVNTTTEVPITTNGTHTIEVANKICEEDITVNVNVPGVIVNATTVTKEIAKTARNTSLSIQGGKFVNFSNVSGSDIPSEYGTTLLPPGTYTEIDNNLILTTTCNTTLGTINILLYRRTTNGLIIRDTLLNSALVFTTSSSYKNSLSRNLNIASLGNNLYAVAYIYETSTGTYSQWFNCGLCTFSVENEEINIIRNDTTLFSTNFTEYGMWYCYYKKNFITVKADSSHIYFMIPSATTYTQYADYIKCEVTYPETPTATSQAPVMTMEAVNPRTTTSYGVYGYNGYHYIDDTHFAIETLSTNTNSSMDYINLILYKVEGDFGNIIITQLSSIDTSQCSVSYSNQCHFTLENNIFTGVFGRYYSSYYYVYFVKITYANETLTRNIFASNSYSSSNAMYPYSCSNTIEVNGEYYTVINATGGSQGGRLVLIRVYKSSSSWYLRTFNSSTVTTNSIARPLLYHSGSKFTMIGRDWIDYYEPNAYINVPSSGATTANGFIAQNGTFTSGQQVLVAIPQ